MRARSARRISVGPGGDPNICKTFDRNDPAVTGHHRKGANALGFVHHVLRPHQSQVDPLALDRNLGNSDTVVERIDRLTE